MMYITIIYHRSIKMEKSIREMKKEIRDKRNKELKELIEFLELNEYICSKCNQIHKRNTKVYSFHFNHRTKDEKLTSNEIWIFQFKKSWNRHKRG